MYSLMIPIVRTLTNIDIIIDGIDLKEYEIFVMQC